MWTGVLHEASTGLHRLRWSRCSIPELKQDPAAFAVGWAFPVSATPQPQEHSRNTKPNTLTQPDAENGGGIASRHRFLERHHRTAEIEKKLQVGDAEFEFLTSAV